MSLQSILLQYVRLEQDSRTNLRRTLNMLRRFAPDKFHVVFSKLSKAIGGLCLYKQLSLYFFSPNIAYIASGNLFQKPNLTGTTKGQGLLYLVIFVKLM